MCGKIRISNDRILCEDVVATQIEYLDLWGKIVFTWKNAFSTLAFLERSMICVAAKEFSVFRRAAEAQCH